MHIFVIVVVSNINIQMMCDIIIQLHIMYIDQENESFLASQNRQNKIIHENLGKDHNYNLSMCILVLCSIVLINETKGLSHTSIITCTQYFCVFTFLKYQKLLILVCI